jgi:Domain of unknown function (DUF4279)
MCSGKTVDSKLAKRSRATLTILSRTLTADELVRAIGVTPDRVVEKGSPVKGTSGGVHRYSVVAFESHLDADAEPSTHLDELLLRLSPIREAIRALADPGCAPGARDVPVRLSLYIESPRRMLGIDLSAERLAAIGEFGAHLGVEVDTDCVSLG